MLRKTLGTLNVERDDIQRLEPWQEELTPDDRLAIRRTFELQDRPIPQAPQAVTQTVVVPVVVEAHTRAKARKAKPAPNFTSPLKKGIWQALFELGDDCGYQQVANWISEHLSDITLPESYGDRVDLGLAVRHDPEVRQNFQRTFDKVKSAMKG